MNILDKIVAHKKGEVAKRKELYPVKLLEQSIYFDTPAVSMREYIRRPDLSGIIAEFKRRSPSKGDINPYASVERVTIGYMQAGASALSVLTDEHFFGGKNADLTEARKNNFCPILRKDFIIDEYQIIEARSIGADVILLIAECLTAAEVKALSATAHELGLEVLMEVHSPDQLEKLSEHIDLVGVNNRNLKDFTVSIQHSIDALPAIPDQVVKISESGINDPRSIVELKEAGFEGFLIGEYFMQADEPELRAREFVQRIRKLEELSKNAIT
ncbi:indole-3-glycerol phosphate synthase TrpC [Flavilitoribacter nigricans]|uniref:indole-3-glycerol-phosphate synthase n=1 Tax=Flavilitoribacter nigricans (strain ATCC 23147 / DSM 23189 / NBRC 102662 / NCIMB 1420 / SS-2) TaxID=1122177 RepID=A0A2D0NJX8_FLAN2|nr:indole-3-glycerol phosphate synthase TrpC [Flavilitoribacter nigricans]PHN08509.1 indole-3-glycerol phosphate synthase [Flavilitoribacter nigricans DSM 23189 = NBRC 102662]